MSATIKREVLTEDDANLTLSYITDLNINNPTIPYMISKVACKLSYTIAQGTGQNTYVYPRGIFEGNKQVYPPISLTTLNNLNVNSHAIDVTWIDTMKLNIGSTYNLITQKSYIPQGIFTITYGTTRTSTSYVSRQIPSFTPEQATDNQFAYVQGMQLLIKDPLLPSMPVSDMITFDSTTGIPANTAWHFEINTNSTTNELKTKYDTTAFPLSYTKEVILNDGKRILRRQFNLGNNLKLKTTKYTNQGNSFSYYKFNYYYNNQKVTTLNDIFYLSPKFNQTSNPNAMCIAKPSGNYANGGWTEATANYNGETFNAVINKAKVLFNVFLIKVNGNEHMNSWGWEMKKHNIEEAVIDQTYYFYQLCEINTITPNNFFGYTVNINPEPIQNTYNLEYLTNNPINKSAINSTYNPNPGAFELPNISITPTPNGNLTSNSYQYISYSDAQLMSDVNNIEISTGNSPGFSGLKKIIIDINMNSNSTYKHISTANSSMVNSYTYCYLAADIIREYNSGSHVYTRRVISPSYLCIKAEHISGTFPSSTYYLTEYVDTF